MTDFNKLADQFLDPYARQARLAPALVVIVPIVLLVMVWFPASLSVWGALVSVACSCGLMFLLSQIARDRGKQKEPDLYAGWGGKPSVALLRHRDCRIDQQTKAQYCAFLKSKLPLLVLPTEADENADQDRADAAYESVTAWLLTQTRDTKIFNLLFRENISYGFRRNLWGLKPIGVAATLLAAAASTFAIGYTYWTKQTLVSPEIILVTAIVCLLFVIWIALITRTWVRISADAYGRQLLTSCDTLAGTATTTSNRAKGVRSSTTRSKQIIP
jgi:hypothetical protein